jgi:tetratricopeptide (TPR) repeat protein
MPDSITVTRRRLYISHAPELDKLIALEFGRVGDGTPPRSWRGIGERFAFLHDGRAPDGPIVGFGIEELSSFDPESPENAPIWQPPRFDAPQLGLTAATAGEIVVATHSLYGQEPSLNRIYFNLAAGESGEDALALWLACLQTGDPMAHFGLGYTLYELGRFHEAYRHLRYYAEISPGHPWNWCWLGKAAEAIGETAEARGYYERAIELEEAGGDETDAMAQLSRLSRQERRG